MHRPGLAVGYDSQHGHWPGSQSQSSHSQAGGCSSAPGSGAGSPQQQSARRSVSVVFMIGLLSLLTIGRAAHYSDK
jgi:hypothetical protein